MSQVQEWPTWPQYGQEHKDAVVEVVESNQLFAASQVKAFESEYSHYTGSAYALGLGNATEALHLALAALKIGRGDEVIVTPYSWISSASCVLMQNAIPIFVDIESETFGLDPSKILQAITPRTKAVVLVHMFGLCSKIDEIHSLCKKHNIFLVEDCSHAHGASFKNKKLGTFGDIGVFSLHQRKALSVGDGGVLITDSELIYESVYKLRSFGCDQLSYNYRMTEFAGALGRVGLRFLERQNKMRIQNHLILKSRINDLGLSGIYVISPMENVEGVFYSNLIVINYPRSIQEELLLACAEAKVPLKRTWSPLNHHPHFKRENMINHDAPWDCLSTKFIEPDQLCLPISQRYQSELLFELDCHPYVREENIERAVDIIKRSIHSKHAE